MTQKLAFQPQVNKLSIRKNNGRNQKKSEDRNFLLRISYVEIYNERVRVLLTENVVDLPYTTARTVLLEIEGLKEVVITEMAQVEELLVQAQEHRKLGDLLKELSSRPLLSYG
ncbi:hypothetical protein OSTOST_01137 [Ostertagia ostertagi]